MTDIDLRGVSERDLDLFLLEEVVASDAFRSWFVSRIDLDPTAELIRAGRSVTTSTGESDLEFTYEDSDGRTIRVLVENKVDAMFQHRQPERYAERAEAYVQAGECDEAKTVLFAPDVYSSDNAGFDYRITYEDVRKLLESRPNSSSRYAYKLALLEAAIHRGTSGWTLEPDEAVTNFWDEYWKRASSLAPQLRMAKPGAKPATSTFVRFNPAALPPGITLIHKFAHGNVDLQFSGLAARASEFHRRYSGLLDDGMAIAEAGKSLAVRIEVPTVQPETPFAESADDVVAGLHAAARLVEWYVRYEPHLEPDDPGSA